MVEKEDNVTSSGQPEMTLREKIEFYLIDCETPLGKFIDIFIILLNFIICFIVVIETYPISQTTRNFMWMIEIYIVVLFAFEYFARLYGSANRWKQLTDIYSIIDLVAIIPTLLLVFLPWSFGFLRLIRIFRVFRIFRFIRFAQTADFFFGTIRMQVLRVVRLLLTIFIIFFVSSGLFYIVESPINNKVQTFGDAFYFTVVSITTVGFGDITPYSEIGRWVTVFMILSGIILIPWQASQIIKNWIQLSEKKLIICKQCGLRYHDKDASHCKACGHVIFQEYDGN